MFRHSLKTLTEAISPLLYTKYLAGNSNFHLQLRRSKTSQQTSPSYFGDAGFWAIQKEFDDYIHATNSLPEFSDKVSKPLLDTAWFRLFS
jgi:hypothetical protein